MLIAARPFLFSNTEQLTDFEETSLGRDEHEPCALSEFFTEPSINLPASTISFVGLPGFVLLVSLLYCGYVAERKRKGRAFKDFGP